MPENLTRKIIAEHLVHGEMTPGQEIGLRIDQTLTQDATGTMAYLQFEALGLDRVQTELSVSYVDHNTMQMGFRNAEDHRYLRTVAGKYGLVFSPPGLGICHQLHLENFAIPGKTLIGSDSHTPTAGGMGALAMGAGGLSVALAMAGEPYVISMPKVMRVWLDGKLKNWTAAKDVILQVLRELSVKGGVGYVLEYAGPGVATLTVPERATITNMGAELGATTSIFPSDDMTKSFLRTMHREQDFRPLEADEGASYDAELKIDLSELEPLAACPHMPDKVVPVRELHGLAVDQVCIGSCTNSSYSDLATVAEIFKQRNAHEEVDFMIAPGSKLVLRVLAEEGYLNQLLDTGARLLECACGPCIGMGGSPVGKGVSVRTFNRNFEGRSGTQDAQVFLVSPQTAAHTAVFGAFTDPEEWGQNYLPQPEMPRNPPLLSHLFQYPPEPGTDEYAAAKVVRGENIVPLEPFTALPERLETAVALVLEDDITTDHILPAGPAITALRSNIPAISEYIFSRVDEGFVPRIKKMDSGVVVAGENYGQGSSREHAALAPRHLGVRAVLAKSFARIHRANLVNFGILPLLFENKDDHAKLQLEQKLSIPAGAIEAGKPVDITLEDGSTISVTNDLSAKELEIIKAGGLLQYVKAAKARQQ